MATGIKTGGRTKGTANKATLARRAAEAPSTSLPLAGAREADDPSIDIDVMKFPRYKLAKVDSLLPYANNARTHTEAQILKIMASIREFGFTNPVLTDGRRGIVAGHGRVIAARRLAMDVVPTIELSHLTPAQRRTYILADNRLALDAGWDDELLRLELGELRDCGFDMTLTGFGEIELDKLFGEPAEDPAEQVEPEDGVLDGKVCCPSCGHEFQTVAKAFRLAAARKPHGAA